MATKHFWWPLSVLCLMVVVVPASIDVKADAGSASPLPRPYTPFASPGPQADAPRLASLPPQRQVIPGDPNYSAVAAPLSGNADGALPARPAAPPHEQLRKLGPERPRVTVNNSLSSSSARGAGREAARSPAKPAQTMRGRGAAVVV
jgi:hypothetical protein